MNSESSKASIKNVNGLIASAKKLPKLLGNKLFDEAIVEAKKIEKEPERASALIELTKQLPVEFLDKLIVPAQELPDDLYRTLIFRIIAERSPQEKQVAAYAMALLAIDEIKDTKLRKFQLDKVLEQLPHQRFEEVLKYAKEYPDLNTRIKELIPIADRAQEDRQSELLEDVSNLQNENERAESFSHVVPHLASVQLQRALRISRDFQNSSHKAS